MHKAKTYFKAAEEAMGNEIRKYGHCKNWQNVEILHTIWKIFVVSLQ